VVGLCIHDVVLIVLECFKVHELPHLRYNEVTVVTVGGFDVGKALWDELWGSSEAHTSLPRCTALPSECAVSTDSHSAYTGAFLSIDPDTDLTPLCLARLP